MAKEKVTKGQKVCHKCKKPYDWKEGDDPYLCPVCRPKKEG